MLSVLFGLIGAASFGSADFLGGLAARLIGSMRTAWIGAIFGLITMIVVFVLLGGSISQEALFWGALSGLSGMIAVTFLYASLAIGPMSVLSPIGALAAAIVPVMWDFVRGEQLSVLAYAGIAIALVAVWFVGFVPDPNAVKPSARGITFAIMAGTFIGLFLILIDRAPDDAGVLPLIANRIVQVGGLTLAVLSVVIVHWLHTKGMLGKDGPARADIAVGERGALNWRRGLPLAAATGAVDAIGNSFILYGLVIGNLSIIAVLSSMYPGATILLAAIVLRERIARIQYLGLALALLAAALLAVG